MQNAAKRPLVAPVGCNAFSKGHPGGSRALKKAEDLLRKLEPVDFSSFVKQLVPHARDAGLTSGYLLQALLEFLVLKKIAGDEDGKILSPPLAVDAVWHQMLLNPVLYAEVSAALGGDMVNHYPQGGLDKASQHERVCRTVDFYKVVFFSSGLLQIWAKPNPAPVATGVIFIARLTGETVNVPFCAEWTVLRLKTELANISGIPPDQMKFIFAGRHMEDDWTLEDYGLKEGCTVHCVLRLSGC